MSPHGHSASRGGFSLVEVLVSSAILGLIVVLLAGVTMSAGDTVRRVGSQTESYQSARAAFESMTREIASATLNTRWDYDDPNNPRVYLRSSDMHFVIERDLAGTSGTGFGIFFVAPLSRSDDSALAQVGGLLSACGYYVEYGSDLSFRPSGYAGPERFRYRLMRLVGRTESLNVTSDSSFAASGWYAEEIADGQATPIAENVVALVFWPRLSEIDDPEGDDLTADFSWNSRRNASAVPQPVTAHQMPPVLDVLAVVLDEQSAARLSSGPNPSAPLDGILDGLFLRSNASDFESDRAELERRLRAITPAIDFRLLKDSVVIRENKWSAG